MKCDIATEDQNDTAGVRSYSFENPSRLSRTNLRALHMVLSDLETSWSSSLSSMLRSEVSVQVNPLYEAPCHEYAESARCSRLVLEASSDPPSLVILMDIGKEFAWRLADRMVGGAGGDGEGARILSTAQTGIVKCLVNRLLKDMQKAWAPVIEVQLSVSAVHDSRCPAEIAGHEPILVAETVWRTEAGESSVNIAIPISPLSELADSLDPQKWLRPCSAQKSAPRESMSSLLETVCVPVAVELGCTRVSMRDLLSMEAGDVVRLNTRTTDPLEVKLGRESRFHASPGLIGRRVSVQISEDPTA